MHHSFPIRLWPWRILVFCLCAAVASRTAAADPDRELGQPYLQNYPPREYRAHNQTWIGVQDARGVIYIGNKGLVLEFDGARWRQIVLPPDTTFVRGLAIEPGTGRIFVGAPNEIGYLQDDLGGGKKYVSLVAQLPADTRAFEAVSNVFATPEGILFVAGQQVMRWRGGKFTVWKLANSSNLRGFSVGGRVYLQHPDLGLLRFDGERFQPASADELFRKATVAAMLPRADGTALVFTCGQGEAILRPDGSVTPFATEIDGWLKDKLTYRALALADGRMLLSTDSAGLSLLSAEGKLLARIDESTGLPNELVHGLFQDREGGVWVCHNAGVARLELASALSVFDTATGLRHATVHRFVRWHGDLVAATNAGVYRLRAADPAGGSPRAARWELLPGLSGLFLSLCVHEGSGLLAAGDHGVFLLADGAAQAVPLVGNEQVWVLHRSLRAPDRVFYSTERGSLHSLRLVDGRWQDEGASIPISRDARKAVEAPDGTLWIGTAQHGVQRIEFTPGVPPRDPSWGRVSTYFMTAGLPPEQGWTRVVNERGGGVLFATQAGLYRFDEAAKTFRPAADYPPRLTDGYYRDGELGSAADGSLWISVRPDAGEWPDQEIGHALRAAPGTPARWLPLASKVPDRLGEIEAFLPEAESGVVWIGGVEGIVRVDSRRLPAADPGSQEFHTLIRRVFTTARGASGEIETTPIPARGQPLSFARNSPAFEYAADTYAASAKVRYQTRLEGFGAGEWSGWTERASAEYANLPEGRYVFHVRAADADLRPGSESTFAFEVLPPWQRTPWAYSLYGALAVLAVFGMIRWRGQQLRRRNAMLETLVDDRTSELRARESELRAREVELLRARDEAEASNRAKSAFLAHMSHELRTPLNAILGYTRLLLKDRDLSARTLERMSVVNQSGNHLLAMINEVLDLAKIEAGKVSLSPSVFRLDALLDEAQGAYRARAAEKGLAFRCILAGGLPEAVRGDAGKLRQVIFNLLENALKFTERGSITLRVSPAAPDRVRCEVIDTGIGIAAEERSRVFVAFHQVAGNPLSAQGAGLGLAISDRLAAMLGGRLELESDAGRGSRFWFEADLPAAPADGLYAGVGTRTAPVAYEGQARRVLIADDQPFNRAILRDGLLPLGFEITEVEDGARCLEKCLGHPAPDVLLLDLRMPGLDGLAVARALRDRGQTLKIVAVSASVFESDRQEALAAGCDDFLPKPFEEAQLLEILGRLLGLEWIFPDRQEAGGTLFTGTDAPPAGEVEALLDLARRGDILGIRRRLAALAAADGGRCRAFTERLQPFVAGWQMNRIEEALQNYQQETNAQT